MIHPAVQSAACRPIPDGAVVAAGEQRAVSGESDRIKRPGAGIKLGDLGAGAHVPEPRRAVE